MVLVDDRNAEHGHHRVTDELLDRSPVALERPRDDFEIPRQDPADGLGLLTLGQARRVGHVGEDARGSCLPLGGRVGRRLGALAIGIADGNQLEQVRLSRRNRGIPGAVALRDAAAANQRQAYRHRGQSFQRWSWRRHAAAGGGAPVIPHPAGRYGT